jgi:predicted metal-binding membrane protein
MIPDTRDAALVRNIVLSLSVLGWLCILANVGGLAGLHDPGAMGDAMSSPAMLLAMHPPAALAAGWALMLLAMMSPVLIPDIRHIRLQSLKRHRARVTLLFVAGYAAVWMAVGAVLLAVSLWLGMAMPGSYLPAIAVLLLALVWQMSPFKQRSLNRCHALPEMPAFGKEAAIAALRSGVVRGMWCVGSCWLLMLLPLVLHRDHLVVMIAVTVLILGERLEPPAAPAWRWRGPAKLTRLVAARSLV